MFEQLSGETGIPTILLASIALQESGCNPGVTGSAGEIGMMQVTKEKCPKGDIGQCYDAYVGVAIIFYYRDADEICFNLDKHWDWGTLLQDSD